MSHLRTTVPVYIMCITPILIPYPNSNPFTLTLYPNLTHLTPNTNPFTLTLTLYPNPNPFTLTLTPLP